MSMPNFLKFFIFVSCVTKQINVQAVSRSIKGQENCGTQTYQPNIKGDTLNSETTYTFERITNGVDSASHSWPWAVSLRVKYGDKVSTHYCGG